MSILGGGSSGLGALPWPPSAQQQAPVYHPWGVPQANFKHAPENMRAALAIRMGWNVNQTGLKYFEYCEPRKLDAEKAVVFVIHEGKALAIEDDLNLFPSDALVTQLRLLQDTK
ncbi:hypothetical protein [Bradyrhizobium genosp. SA-3]|uniref:hypothetical protein n=1 Tax=Bradyrhizobium genosp. SA-3 TaxID=508868 RepID=UPI001029CC10|nr:hypothetical protein [Bradyrhizobium genosp. SA-3]